MDEERIVAAAEQAARHGGPVAAVLPMRTTAGAVRFACALQRDDGFAWVVLDESGEPLEIPAEIRSVAETIAICETAEESAAMLAAGEADGLLLKALDLVGDDDECCELLADLIRGGFRIIEFRPRRADLEQIFMDVTKGDVQ